MKSALKNLYSLKSRIEEKIEARENYFDERSDKWLESEKADMYEEKTSELQSVLDSIEDAIQELENYLE